jgi:hypothetical protein
LGETAAVFCSAAFRVTVLALSSLNVVCVPLPSDDRRGAKFIILQTHSVSRPPWTNIIFFSHWVCFTAFRFLILAE